MKDLPTQRKVCIDCGNPVNSAHRWCAKCSRKNSIVALIEGAKLGRLTAHAPAAQKRLKETKLRHDLARSQWSHQDQPAWLTEEVYEKQIQPQLVTASLSQIASAIGVSIPYASDIRKGRRRPHPRHWQALAKLVGIAGAPDFS
jgi:hypothetical protein